jgi:hypothetical protein
MDMTDRISQTERCIRFISTKFDETDAELVAALGLLTSFIASEVAAIPTRRAEVAARAAAKAKELEDQKAAIIAAGGTIPPPIQAKIGL